MSRSRKITRAIDEPRDYKTQKRKMAPYAGKDTGGKFLPEKDVRGKITKNAKLIAKNANRSKKKSARQQAKRDINENL